MKKAAFCLGSMLLVIIFLAMLSSCQVGPSSLYVDPAEMGYDYKVTYDCLGGEINTMPTRSVYYEENALLALPSGAAGMLVEPEYGEKSFLGWYTAYELDENGNHVFHEEDKWDFDQDRLTPEVAPNKELTLYARWMDTPKVYFVDADDPSHIYLTWTINVGSKMSRPTAAEPKKAGYSLLDYYYDPECTQKALWGEDSANIEDLQADENNAEVYIYCKFLEGDYTRISRLSEFSTKIANDPAGSYILANDIDLAGASLPCIDETFTGTFIGNGYAICNGNWEITSRKSGFVPANTPANQYGLFTAADNARIDGLFFRDIDVSIRANSNIDVVAGLFCGSATNVEFTNCGVENCTFSTSETCKKPINITVGPLCGKSDNTTYTQCTLPSLSADSIDTAGQVIVN